MRILLLLSTLASAASVQSLLPLRRLTVGPYDNLQGLVDNTESTLYYTRSENLSSQLYKLNLNSGLSSAITEANADAKNPALSPNSQRLAFTYFKFDAKGDICLYADTIECISKPGEVDHSPVWWDNDKLIYLSTDNSGSKTKIKLYTLETRTTTTIAEGYFTSPDISSDGQKMVYNSNRNKVVIANPRTMKTQTEISIELPGISGPARFSVDGKSLYFAQYLTDSNQDLRIDGRDAAAIFRIDLADPSHPIQLTSLEQNCSYPYPGSGYLYMTCAFEGALDVYRAPTTGTVPKDWKEKDIIEAHQSARSYSDRILFLNQLHSRFKKIDTKTYELRLLQNFLYANQFQAMLYYVDRFATREPDQPRWKIWKTLFQSYAAWQSLTEKKSLGRFRDQLAAAREQLASYRNASDATLATAYLDFFVEQPIEARRKLLAYDPSDEESRYLVSHLARKVLGKDYPSFAEQKLIGMSTSQENQLYFLNEWLSVSKEDPTTAVPRLRLKLKGPVLEVLENEIDLQNLIKSTDKKSAIAAYRPIAARAKRLKPEYYAMRMLFSRSIVMLSNAQRTRDIADIVSLWTSYLHRDTKEFPYAISALRQTSIDIAYLFLNSKGDDQKFAIGAFSDALRTSDDLEAHYQYTLLNLQTWQTIVDQYNVMVREGLISPKSQTFINVIKMIQDPDIDTGIFNELIAQLETIDDNHVGSGMKYLLIGYLYHRQLATSGFSFDRTVAEQAHKAYTFALDAAVFNDRIRAAAFQNLGVLHLQTRNFSLSADYFIQRLNFAPAKDQQALEWLAAKANYLSGRSSEAARISAASVKSLKDPRFLEKAAFYAWNAGQYRSAIDYYKRVPNLSTPMKLGYGYALLKDQRFQEARTMFDQVIAEAGDKSVDVPSGSLRTQPMKQSFIAMGLIAQNPGFDASTRKSYLQKRLALFPLIIANVSLLHFDQRTLRHQQVKETQDLAELGDSSAWIRSMALAKDFAETYGYFNNTVMTALKNTWIREQKLPADLISSIVQSLDEEYSEMPIKSRLSMKEWAQFKIIQRRTNKQSISLEKILASLDPDLKPEILAYARAAGVKP